MIDPLRLSDTLRRIDAGHLDPARHVADCNAAMAAAAALGAYASHEPRLSETSGRKGGPLAGTVFAVKDLVDVAGAPTGGGRLVETLAGSATDAPVVSRLRRRGATPLGKTRTDELGLGTFTPGAVNPWDATRTVGGSSGGSALAVALGAADFALVTDTAGSARIPAAGAGVAGMCVASDWETRDGVLGLSPTFDRLGLIAATGHDLAVLWRRLGGTVGPGSVRAVRLAGAGATGRVDAAWAHAARRAACELARRWELQEPEVTEGPDLRAYGPPRATVITADAATRYGTTATTEPARAQLRAGAGVSAAEADRARSELSRLGHRLRDTVGGGLLVVPTLPTAPPRWDELTGVDDRLRAIGRLTRLCAPVNSSALVAVSVPYGHDADGLPVSVQIVGGSESSILAAAECLS